MGRIFEKRKYTIFARNDRNAKAFTKWGKEIAISVKQGGMNPDTNARLRTAIQNAKNVNMPKDRIEAAIKRASLKDERELKEIIYEGYGPHGVGILVEAATDNPTRTVANVRLYFTKAGGTIAASGAVAFMFERKGVFCIKNENVDADELELDLIDFGAEDFLVGEHEIYIHTSFADFAGMQKRLEEKKLGVISAELQYLPTTQTELTDVQSNDVMKLVGMLEDDDDVQNTYHTMK